MLPFLILIQVAVSTTPAAEEPVEPYAHSNTNAGATPFQGDAMWTAFRGQAGVARIVNGMLDRSTKDPRISDIFQGQDMVRLRRTLNEQFCYILGGGCTYTGRDMKAAHKDLGVQAADFGPLVENLEKAMSAEHIPYSAQSRFLAKLAPIRRDTVQR